WLDINNPQSTPENADAPFVASPQIFRMAPHSGQMVRLSFVGQPLARDRESLFYLNFLQVPAVRQTDSDKNKLLLVVTNRLKVFYRPAG
ncbi:fimbria/pilus periplasmic chaperone, partial [Paenibacillus polymyxa]|nr:fimbria/pilus periplasmic chaperone [Paenibacillus polymyxa]